jgi:hypothetical protein
MNKALKDNDILNLDKFNYINSLELLCLVLLGLHNTPKTNLVATPGNPAISVRPVAFRRRLTAVLALSKILS